MAVMMKGNHGGDVYTNQVRLDFSVNVNPLGIPEAVRSALYEAVEACGRYPDITAERLQKAVSQLLHAPGASLLFGNGASELFMAVAHGIKPKKTVIPVPSFYGYEHAAKAAGGEIVYYETKEENAFCLTEDFLSVLNEETELLFVANPNNPTGNLMSRDVVKKLLCHCRDKKIHVVLDECFIDFCGKEASMLEEIEQFENLILIKAFTKTFAVPGVRLGYLVCSNLPLLEQIRKQLPEWNLSVFAQAAGCACASQTGFLKKTAAYVQRERRFLSDGLKRAGVRVFSGEANFLLVYSGQPLYEALLKKGLMIRDCENFRGLSKGFYRIAVKSREENEILIKAIGEIKWKETL